MDDILLVDATERYLKGEMSDGEKLFFEELRSKNPEVDQLVVEHALFFKQINAYGANRNMRRELNVIHSGLMETGEIKEITDNSGGRVIRLWNRYKNVTAIAATIAGITALFISGLVTYPVAKTKDLNLLSREVAILKQNDRIQHRQIIDLKSKAPADYKTTKGGTGFLIDIKGYLATNAHVVSSSSTIVVQNNRGQEFKARTVYTDEIKDLAILKIEDDDFKSFLSLPYSIRKTNSELGEQIFTLGFPKDEIVYNEGYLSAKTGFKGDTITCQIAVSANPGNSGGPVLNKFGEVIGILSTSQVQAEGVVFAIKSKNIFQAMDELKKDTSYQRVKLPVLSNIKGMDRVQQIKQIEDCVFMVNVYTK